MKKVVDLLISFYPKTWRDRYENEFQALLDDVPPAWSTLFDVFLGAIKMQMKIWSAWKTIAAFGLVGAVVALAASFTIPRRYVSTAVIKASDGGPEELNAQAQRILSRATLMRLITEEDLYKRERTRDPLEQIVQQMKQNDIMVRPVDSQSAFSISFSAPDAVKAQRVTQRLTAAFLDAKAGPMVLDPANLPEYPVSPRLPRIVVMGLIMGAVAGALFALFTGLKVWKLAASLGIAGAIVGTAVGFALPERIGSEAVLRYDGPEAGMRQLVAAAASDANLRVIAQRLQLYTGESAPEARLREHLHIELAGNGSAIVIRFDDTNQYVPQKVVFEVASLVIESTLGNGSGVRLVQLLDPPALPLGPYFPNRPAVIGTGFLAGLACAALWGAWRVRRPWNVAAL